MARYSGVFIMLLGTAGLFAMATAGGAMELDRPPGTDEVDYAPTDGSVVQVSPPAFVWLPVEGADRYVLQYAQDPEFSGASAITVDGIEWLAWTPHEPLAPGTWYWRYGAEAADGTRAYSQVRRFTVPDGAPPFPRPTLDDVLARIPDTRPRVYFTPEKVAEVRREREGAYAALVAPVVRNAEQRIGEPLYAEPDFLPQERQARTTAAVRIFRTMRPFTAGMETCALAYIYTGEPRFAEEAKRRLLHFTTWDLDGSSNVFHNTEPAMDIAQRGPRTYDWIYDTLTDAERAAVEHMLTSRLADMHRLHRSRPFETRPYSSHPGRMIGFVVEGGIVFAHEHAPARTWLDYTLQLLWSTYPAWGSSDGGWHEGLSYWTSYGNRMVWIVGELDRLGIPWKNKPFLRNTPYFGLYCAYPARKHLAFGDGYEGRVGSSQGNLMYAYASIYDNAYFRWYADQLDVMPSGPQAVHLYRPDMEAKPPADLPQSRAFKDVGWVAMHSDMASPADNVLLLFKSTPYGAISHNHANQNVFVLEAFGEPLAISSGYYQRYGSPHHAEWSWQTKAHNGILVDWEGQTPRSAESKGAITAYQETGDFSFTTGDAVQAYDGRLRKALRHVLFARPDYFVILDELESPGASTYQWLLHSPREMRLDESGQRITLANGDARLHVALLEPQGLKFTQTTGFNPLPDEPDSAAQWHFTASTAAPEEAMRFVSVLIPYRAGDAGAAVDPALVPAEGGLALRAGSGLILWRNDSASEVRTQDAASTALISVHRQDAQGQWREVFAEPAP